MGSLITSSQVNLTIPLIVLLGPEFTLRMVFCYNGACVDPDISSKCTFRRIPASNAQFASEVILPWLPIMEFSSNTKMF